MVEMYMYMYIMSMCIVGLIQTSTNATHTTMAVVIRRVATLQGRTSATVEQVSRLIRTTTTPASVGMSFFILLRPQYML